MRKAKLGTFLILLSVLAAGCHSVPKESDKNIRDEPTLYDATTERTIPDLAGCITRASDFRPFASYLQTTTSPDNGKTDIMIRAIYKGAYREEYLIEMKPHYGMTEVSVRSNTKVFEGTSDADLQGIVSDCAGDRRY